MPNVSLSPSTSYVTRNNILVPGPSSVAAGLKTRAQNRILDDIPGSTVVTLATPSVNGEATIYGSVLAD
jgi:hypothetical protein